MGRKLILVTKDDITETPLFVSESRRDVAEYLGCSLNALNMRIFKNRRNGEEEKKTRSGLRVFEVELTDSEYMEVTDAKA